MSDKKYNVVYGSRCTVIPGTAAEKIIGGHATASDIRVLFAALELYSRETPTASKIAELTGLAVSEVESSMAYWRGTGIVSVSETVEVSPNEKNAPDAENGRQNEAGEKKPHRNSAPKYSGAQISDILEKDGGGMKSMIDECQQLVGHIFNPTEISSVVGMCDWLGLTPEFVVTVAAYYTRKKPGCSVRYIERAATDLVNNGITSMKELDEYLKEMELYDGIAGKLRTWLGIGGRAYTQKENGMIKRWVRDFSYGEDVIHLAYEITVDSKGAFNFDYANKILENWYASGVRDLAGANEAVSAFREEKKAKSETGGSFDTDEFFSLALRRSYKNMQETEPDNNG